MSDTEKVDPTELRVDESYWPVGSSEVLRRWLTTTYDPTTMPALITNRREDGCLYVLGWNQDDEDEIPLQLIVCGLLGHEPKVDVPCPCGRYAAPTCDDCGEDLEGHDHSWCD